MPLTKPFTSKSDIQAIPTIALECNKKYGPVLKRPSPKFQAVPMNVPAIQASFVAANS